MNTTTQFGADLISCTNSYEDRGFRFQTVFSMSSTGINVTVNCNMVDVMNMDSLTESKDFPWESAGQANAWANGLRVDIVFGRRSVN